jgi:2'-5' RNA ligase
VRAKRLFVSLDLPESVARTLADQDPQIDGVRWLPAEAIHLTLAFLGMIEPEREENLRKELPRIQFKSFFLPLQRVGTFPSRGCPKVIWLGVGHGHPHLFQLHKKVADAALAAGLEPDLRPWHPHITLARCREIRSPALTQFLRRNAELDAGLAPINEFHLKSSQLTPAGSIYTTELTVTASNSRVS